MTYLKIDNNKGYFRLNASEDNWIGIDLINKEQLLALLEKATTEGFEMDEYEDELLKNPAHNIIYQNIYRKFKDLLINKTRFKDSAESTYKKAIDKYKLQNDQDD